MQMSGESAHYVEETALRLDGECLVCSKNQKEVNMTEWNEPRGRRADMRKERMGQESFKATWAIAGTLGFTLDGMAAAGGF